MYPSRAGPVARPRRTTREVACEFRGRRRAGRRCWAAHGQHLSQLQNAVERARGRTARRGGLRSLAPRRSARVLAPKTHDRESTGSSEHRRHARTSAHRGARRRKTLLTMLPSDANRLSSGPRADAYRVVKFDGPPVPGAGSLLSFSTGTPVPTSIPIILGIRAVQGVAGSRPKNA